jgi:2',3'-cyclic-nucleotide 2'-phosphodiesterase (5'-nucleotidase family)
MRTFTFIAAAFALSSGCVAYNDQCKPLVDNPDERIAKLGEVIYMDRPNTRHANNGMGQVFAESFVDVFSNTGQPADFAVLNGGSLRAEGVCVTRNVLGNNLDVTRGLVSEILLFANIVQAADLTEEEVVLMFEHSVERLTPLGSTISAPAGSFLQVSEQVAMTVDCTRPAGDRITALTIGENVIAKPGSTSKRYRAAMSSFILAGNDGYTMLGPKVSENPDRRPAQAQRLGGIDSAIAADYLKRTFTGGKTITTDRTRVNFVGCAVPVPPSN